MRFDRDLAGVPGNLTVPWDETAYAAPREALLIVRGEESLWSRKEWAADVGGRRRAWGGALAPFLLDQK